MVAWSPLLSFVGEEGGMVGGAQASVRVVASRRAMILKEEVATVSFLFVVAAFPEDEIVDVM